MKDNKTVTINGKTYDITTGLPVSKPKPQLKHTKVTNQSKVGNIQSFSQKSREIYKRASQPFNDIKAPLKKVGGSINIARSKSITHFGPKQKSLSSKPINTNLKMDISNVKHRPAKKVEKVQQKAEDITPKTIIENTTKQIKEEATDKKTFIKRHKYLKIISICLVVILAIGFITYLYMPSFSVRIASAQAGINATYPQYHPDGYSLYGPVFYSEGEVVMKFHENNSDKEYIIKESKSSWDSSALKNKVNKDSKGEFIVIEVHGLSIYTYNSNAAWVNGGILYTISGNAKLDNNQLRRIATSL